VWANECRLATDSVRPEAHPGDVTNARESKLAPE